MIENEVRAKAVAISRAEQVSVRLVALGLLALPLFLLLLISP